MANKNIFTNDIPLKPTLNGNERVVLGNYDKNASIDTTNPLVSTKTSSLGTFIDTSVKGQVTHYQSLPLSLGFFGTSKKIIATIKGGGGGGAGGASNSSSIKTGRQGSEGEIVQIVLDISSAVFIELIIGGGGLGGIARQNSSSIQIGGHGTNSYIQLRTRAGVIIGTYIAKGGRGGDLRQEFAGVGKAIFQASQLPQVFNDSTMVRRTVVADTIPELFHAPPGTGLGGSGAGGYSPYSSSYAVRGTSSGGNGGSGYVGIVW